MSQPESESLAERDQDPAALLFGHDVGEGDDVDAGSAAHEDATPVLEPPNGGVGRDRARRRRARRQRRVFAVLTAFIVIVVLIIAFAGYRLYENRYHPKDYSGAGSGAVSVTVHADDRAGDIGKTLRDDGVVASVRAFTNAASDNTKSQGISPGTYRLRAHMSAKNAVSLLLDPASRLSSRVVVFEGATVVDVAAPLAKALGISQAAVQAAIDDAGALGLPRGFTSGARTPTSVEGFLYPATYSFDPGTKIGDALQQMITEFTDKARTTGFTADARAAKISPYAALTIASIAEKEAKVAGDYPKVARVILNRIAARKPLQIDATSAYAAKLKHLDPTKVIYATIDSPYNTYTHPGLPPTPISSPGESAMSAAVHPASGSWLYYVNGDAKGDLVFTDSEAAFEAAVEKCRAHHWGCG